MGQKLKTITVCMDVYVYVYMYGCMYICMDVYGCISKSKVYMEVHEYV